MIDEERIGDSNTFDLSSAFPSNDESAAVPGDNDGGIWLVEASAVDVAETARPMFPQLMLSCAAVSSPAG